MKPEPAGDLREVLDALSEMVCRFRPDGPIVYVNATFARIFGDDPRALSGVPFQAMVHPDDLERVLAQLGTLSPQAPRVEVFARPHPEILPDRHTEWTVRGFFDAEGRLLECQAEGYDVTRRVHAEVAHARSSARARFLAEFSAHLVSSLDLETMLRQVARSTVPFLGDGCTVTLLDPHGVFDRVAIVHREPEIERALRTRQRSGPRGSLTGSYRAWAEIVERGETVLHPSLSKGDIEAMEMDEASRAAGLLQRLRALIVVPLRGREGTVGALALTRSAFFPGPPYGEEDLELAVELGRRAGLAIENAWLHSELKEQAQRKDAFLAVLAHELRNPLAAVQHAIEVLMLPDAAPTVRSRALHVAQRQVRHQARMIDDLLDVSRLTRGALSLKLEQVEVGEAVQEAVEIQRPFAERKRQRLVVERATSGPLLIQGDPPRLLQVVGNLVDNAIKYTPEGGQVRVTMGRRDDRVEIAVHDDGPGIPPEIRATLFEPFVQGPDRHQRPTSGLGMGLTIARELVLLHGGGIEVREPGEGTSVVVSLPLDRSAQAPEPGAAQTEQEGLRVLVVDDNVDAADMLASLLEAMGHDARTAYDGQAGVEAARQFRPHLMLVDLVMPVLDGYEAARALRADPDTAGLHLVALSGHAQESVVQHVLQAGFDRHETKPVELARLSELLTWAAG